MKTCKSKAVFLTKLDVSDSEAATSVRPSSSHSGAGALLEQSEMKLPVLVERSVVYREAPEGEETFESMEERMEENIYEARKALREGQRDTAIIDSELRTL